MRSCIRRCAFCGSFQSSGSSASLFSSASRARALSKSKMPPQQPDRLLDLFDDRLGFGAHRLFTSRAARGPFTTAACSRPGAAAQPASPGRAVVARAWTGGTPGQSSSRAQVHRPPLTRKTESRGVARSEEESSAVASAAAQPATSTRIRAQTNAIGRSIGSPPRLSPHLATRRAVAQGQRNSRTAPAGESPARLAPPRRPPP
ncbi:hypothetical protein CH340_21440 [Rhodoplanes serenus]|nr:hypothetical protein CH340_21440 [Rhodoplanes serenus]